MMKADFSSESSKSGSLNMFCSLFGCIQMIGDYAFHHWIFEKGAEVQFSFLQNYLHLLNLSLY